MSDITIVMDERYWTMIRDHAEAARQTAMARNELGSATRLSTIISTIGAAISASKSSGPLRVDGKKGYIKKSDLPPRLVRAMEGWGHYQDRRFGDDIDIPSEYAPDYDTLTLENMHEWHEDMTKQEKNADLTYEQFIEQWGLHFEVWLVENCAELLPNLTEIRVEVYK